MQADLRPDQRGSRRVAARVRDLVAESTSTVAAHDDTGRDGPRHDDARYDGLSYDGAGHHDARYDNTRDFDLGHDDQDYDDRGYDERGYDDASRETSEELDRRVAPPRQLLGSAGPRLRNRLAARVPVRLDPGRRGALAVGAGVLVAAVVTGIWLLAQRPQAMSIAAPRISGLRSVVGTAPASTPSPAAGAPSATASSPVVELVVDVAGKVRRPGLYHLPSGARIDDAINAAGGPLPGVDLTSLNLAAPVTDGEQIAVGVRGSADPGGGAVAGGGAAAGDGGSAAAPSGTSVDLNTATLEQLETLPGIGPVLGQQILDYRTQHGSFTSIGQLKDVSGIGDVRFAQLQPLVTL